MLFCAIIGMRWLRKRYPQVLEDLSRNVTRRRELGESIDEQAEDLTEHWMADANEDLRWDIIWDPARVVGDKPEFAARFEGEGEDCCSRCVSLDNIFYDFPIGERRDRSRKLDGTYEVA